MPPGSTRSIPTSRSCSTQELERQRGQIELIASENFTWPSILEAVGSVPTNKYAEGYPGKRYYGGCEVVDRIEQLAIDRAKSLFGAEHANVQPHAGAQANMAVYFALMEPGDTVLSLRLDHGGHLTHGLKVNFSGRLYHIVHYGVSRETNLVDYDEVLALAKEHRPKVILCGGSAYPRQVETWEFRKIADEVGALLWCDMAHFSGLVAAGLHPNPVQDCDVVSSTTHKTLAGPRSGFVLCARGARRRDRPGDLPGVAGRPARARHRREGNVLQDRGLGGVPRVPDPGARERRRARGRARRGRPRRAHRRHRHASRSSWIFAARNGPGRTRRSGCTRCELTTNRNTVPFDERPPTVASGVRLGTPAATMRGLDADDFREVGRIIVGALWRRRRRDCARGRERGVVREAAAVRGLPRLHEVRGVNGAVVEADHPLIRHKVGLLRDVTTTTQMFRQLVNELTLLLTYEATKTLGDEEEVEIETPLETTTARRISGKKVAVCPILRAGMGMLDGFLSLIPGARVGFIGLYRNEETLEPVEYYVKLPADIAERDVILLDPMLATGNSTAAAVETVKQAGASSVRLIALIAAPEGIARIHRDHPDVTIVVAAVDRGLNEKGYIVPGLGDAGDRLYGTK